MRIKKQQKSFTLVENIIAVAIFALLAGVIYQTTTLLVKNIGVYRENTTISSLASEYMEIVHNLPYGKVGTISGNPTGDLPSKTSPATTTQNGTEYKIYYVVAYIDNPADGVAGTDFAANDYKQVKLYVENTSSQKEYYFVTNIVPRGLENLASGGALRINVSDAYANPVPGAEINIVNNSLSPPLILERTSDASGNWTEVGLENSVNSYEISISKNGYSSDMTYGVTAQNPNPKKPHSTVSNGLVTGISFAIDKLSNLSFKTIDQNCSPLSGIGLRVQGDKLIGETPNVYKFNNTYSSNGAGEINLNDLEWDNYTPSLLDTTYMIYGSSPIQNVQVLPDTTQNFTLTLGPKTANSLLVIVKSAATNNPIEGANVTLSNTSPSFNQSKITGGSVWENNNWTGGTGQENFVNSNKYWSDNGGVSTDILPEALRLNSSDGGNTFVSSGTLISSIFDTGSTETEFSTVTWQPTSQSASTSIKFQFASSNTNTATTTWEYLGPDGTSSSYYTSSGSAINLPNGRYVRYQTILETADENFTPALTNLNINYISGCNTPGQVIFTGLTSDANYELTISASGYDDATIEDVNVSGYSTQTVLMN